MTKIFPLLVVAAVSASSALAQPCVTPKDGADRHTMVLSLAKCLGDPDPKVRDALAFERLSSLMRSGELDTPTLADLRSVLLASLREPGSSTILTSFSALTLSEVARTDRLKAWMTGADRQVLVEAAATFLSNIRDYRAFSDAGGYVHAVAHGADLALQLALNPAIDKPQLDRLLAALALQIAPADPQVAYWAGEPDRLARAVVFIAQRKLHSDAEWNAWFAGVMDPKPLASWDAAFSSEIGIRKHHNVRAFLLGVLASAGASDDAGMRQLLIPVSNSLKLVP